MSPERLSQPSLGHGPFTPAQICLKGRVLRRTRSTSGRGSGKPPEESYRRLETAASRFTSPSLLNPDVATPFGDGGLRHACIGVVCLVHY
jgi:hypothetical protein